MKKKSLITLLVIGIVGFSVLFLLFSLNWPKGKPIPLLPLVREEEGNAVEVGAEGTTAETPRLKGVQLSLFDKDQRLNWKLAVEQVIEEDEVCLLSGIKGEYYTVSGQKYVVTAPAGEMDRNFAWLRLAPDVVFFGEEIRLQAAELSWDAQAGEEIKGRKLQVAGEEVRIQAEKFLFIPEEGGMILPGESRWSFQ